MVAIVEIREVEKVTGIKVGIKKSNILVDMDVNLEITLVAKKRKRFQTSHLSQHTLEIYLLIQYKETWMQFLKILM